MRWRNMIRAHCYEIRKRSVSRLWDASVSELALSPEWARGCQHVLSSLEPLRLSLGEISHLAEPSHDETVSVELVAFLYPCSLVGSENSIGFVSFDARGMLVVHQVTRKFV